MEERIKGFMFSRRKSHTSPTFLEILPLEIFELIVQNLIKSPRGLLSLKRTSKICHKLCTVVKIEIPWTTHYVKKVTVDTYLHYVHTNFNPATETLKAIFRHRDGIYYSEHDLYFIKLTLEKSTRTDVTIH